MQRGRYIQLIGQSCSECLKVPSAKALKRIVSGRHDDNDWHTAAKT
ncbi:hypothetical protein FACS1894184_21410 [Clostridia bacterium]|nr:hypothetical protein FACS1894184_21410 [Clostridia bacterium]